MSLSRPAESQARRELLLASVDPSNPEGQAIRSHLRTTRKIAATIFDSEDQPVVADPVATAIARRAFELDEGRRGFRREQIVKDLAAMAQRGVDTSKMPSADEAVSAELDSPRPCTECPAWTGAAGCALLRGGAVSRSMDVNCPEIDAVLGRSLRGTSLIDNPVLRQEADATAKVSAIQAFDRALVRGLQLPTRLTLRRSLRGFLAVKAREVVGDMGLLRECRNCESYTRGNDRDRATGKQHTVAWCALAHDKGRDPVTHRIEVSDRPGARVTCWGSARACPAFDRRASDDTCRRCEGDSETGAPPTEQLPSPYVAGAVRENLTAVEIKAMLAKRRAS